MSKSSIVPPRVPFIDGASGLISREWYLYLLRITNNGDANSDDIEANYEAVLASRSPVLSSAENRIVALEQAAGAQARPSISPPPPAASLDRAAADLDRLSRDFEALRALLLTLRRPADAEFVTLSTKQVVTNKTLGATILPGSGQLDALGNLALGAMTITASAAKTLHLSNATVPTANPVGGGVVYVEAGALKYRGSSGTITVIAPA